MKANNNLDDTKAATWRIRQETSADYNEVSELVRLAFATNDDDDGTVPEYLEALRKKDAFIPELSLVAEENGAIAGQIVLYKTDIETPVGKQTELLLSPLATHPDHFCRGIARTLIDAALALAKGMGFRAVFLCGDPAFYPKDGLCADIPIRHPPHRRSDRRVEHGARAVRRRAGWGYGNGADGVTKGTMRLHLFGVSLRA